MVGAPKVLRSRVKEAGQRGEHTRRLDLKAAASPGREEGQMVVRSRLLGSGSGSVGAARAAVQPEGQNLAACLLSGALACERIAAVMVPGQVWEGGRRYDLSW